MIIGINIDDKEMRKDSKFYISFLNGLSDFYPKIQVVELTVSAFNWINSFSEGEFRETIKILLDFPFKYTIHLNNMLTEYNRSDERELELSLRFAKEINAIRLILHSFDQSISPDKMDKEFYFSPKREEIDFIQRRKEIERLERILPMLNNYKLILSLENALLKANTNQYAYSVNAKNLIQQIKEFDDKLVSLCLDWGHLYIACDYFGWDFNEIIQTTYPYINHMHIHNNFGFRNKNINSSFLHPNGDYHLPIYEGLIQYFSYKSIFSKFEGIFLLEYTFSHCKNLWNCIKNSLNYISDKFYNYNDFTTKNPNK